MGFSSRAKDEFEIGKQAAIELCAGHDDGKVENSLWKTIE
jgi:hypothetical protein